MKTIGFIDYYLSEWHANNYPRLFAQASQGKEFELAFAWEAHHSPGKRPLQQWCVEMNIIPASCLEEVADKCDCICILVSSNPGEHEQLAEYALTSGKPVYIDKTFASSFEIAKRMFERAERSRTPLMSFSALRFCDELISGLLQSESPNILITTGGVKSYHEYGIHQLEMIVSVMGTEVENIIISGDVQNASVILE